MSVGKVSINDIPDTQVSIEKILKRQMGPKTGTASEELYNRANYTNAFLFQNYSLIEDYDKKLINNYLMSTCRLGLLSLAFSAFFNIKLGPLTKNYIFNLPRPLRFMIRTTAWILPLAAVSFYSSNDYNKISMYLVDKYIDRIGLFIKIGDPRIINPFLEEEQ